VPPRSPLDRFTLTQVQWLFVRDPEALTEAEHKQVTWLCDQQEKLATLYMLVQAFRRLVKERRGNELEAWTQACETSGIRELKRFATHLRSEWDPAVAGLTLPESQGQTEGQVHKLKLLKSQMYGRTGFALLRKRVLLAA
jgi:transposase